MGSVVEHKRTDKRTGKTVTQYRAHIRRVGFGSRSKVFATKREALDWIRNNESDNALTKRASAGGKTLASLIEDFIAAGVCQYASQAHLAYWCDQLGNKLVSEITHGDINGALLSLRTRGGRRFTPDGIKPSGKPLTPATINRYAAALSAVFNFAQAHGVIDAHPMKGGKVKKLKEGPGRQRILTPEEETRLLETARAARWDGMYLFVLMLLTTAARKSEVLNLRWRDLDLGRGIAVLGKTKNGAARALPLVAEVRKGLAELSKVRPINSDFVFYDPKQPGRPKNVDTAWQFVRERAGLNDSDDPVHRVVLHTTRHTGVTKIIRNGANLAQAALISGHKTLAMLKRYEHLAADDVLQLAEHALGKVGTGSSKG
ncbi:site-specific integrase [Thauera sp. CAU 1555]|uniref:Site-specific integrase n=1 Tax=Thauera sedimentorum TaxID=2767595 RepID=A0ABR9BB85_9RHOO|nr:site-specific integrase [Thauera sedimentorum]MBC9071826.1 site-specific integrase [Thauera sedimentorum]MBD8502745.1 site-specific integrase [Thauera sedimentorum]